MNRILLIKPIGKNKEITGGVHVNNSIQKILTQIFGYDNVEVCEVEYYSSKFITFFYSLLGFCDGLTSRKLSYIKRKAINFDFIFISTIKYGKILKYIKKTKTKTIVFAHNFESDFVRQYINSMSYMKKLFYLPLKYATKNNEKVALKKVDYFCTLNLRDSNLYFKNMRRQADIFLPISFSDKFNEIEYERYLKEKIEPYLLFIGSDFFGNTEGLFWFIENVLDSIDIRLIVCGSGMDKYKQKYNSKKITFLGYVEDLNKLYYQATAVVLPILSGGGMKTKLAESLMYGKTIFGTPEAFEGYDLEYDKVGGLCINATDFINKINNYISNKDEKMNSYSRNVFKQKYEITKNIDNLRKMLLNDKGEYIENNL
ncbi:MAG: glycosyltransferase family 4 protein [Treponema sp.]|nr:glycosyltransferase family 4 protein [Treponema sp.]